MRYILIFLSLILCAGKVSSRQYINFDFIKQSKGLSSNSVTSIYKDSQGFLWIGTINGLNIYNGREFISFTHSSYIPNSLTNNQITCISEDHEGNLWIGTEKGLNLFDRETAGFRNFGHDPDNSNSISHNWVKQLFPDSKGNFWVATREGLNRVIYDGKEISFERYFPQRINTENTDNWAVQCITEDNGGDLWIGTWDGGLCHFKPSTGKFTHFLKDTTDRYSITGNIVERVGMIEKNLMLIGVSEAEMCIFDPVKRKFYTKEDLPEYKALLEIPAPIYSIEYDGKDILWLGTANGLVSYSFKMKEVVYESNPKIQPTKNEVTKGDVLDQARTVFLDNTGIVWAGIGKAGLGKYDPNKNKFAKWFVPIASEKEYRDYLSDMYYENKSRIWFGTAGNGLIKININGKTLERYYHEESLTIRAICNDVNGFIWIASENGLMKFDPRSKKSVLHLTQEQSNHGALHHNSVINLYKDNNGLIWLITRQGLQLLDPVQNKIIPHKLDSILAIDMISNIFKDMDGDYWISGNKGFCIFEPATDNITYFSSQLNKPGDIGFDEIMDVYQDNNGTIWIGSKSGLFKTEKAAGKQLNFLQVDELSNQIISKIAPDINDNLWLNSSNGIIRYDPDENKIIKYNREDGLTPLAHNILPTEDDKLIILDEKGFYCFHPDSIRENQNIPPVFFTGLSINGREIPNGAEILNGKNLNTLNKLVLKNEQKVLKFRFSVLNYTLPEKNIYAYKLEGYDTSWINIGHANEITLMNLNPGNYKLWVKGANNDNLWNEEGRFIELLVKPPFYKSAWAYTAYLLVLISLFVLLRIYNKNKQKLKRKYEYQQLEATKKYELEKLSIQKDHELDQLKLKFFFDVSHEFRTPLTLILGPLSNILKNDKYEDLRETHEMIQRNAKNLKSLIDQLLDIRKLDVGNIKPVPIKYSLRQSLKKIIESFRYYASTKNINIEAQFSVPEGEFIFDRDKIQKIVTNLLSNALKFSNNSNSISFNAKVLKNDECKSIIEQSRKSMKEISSMSDNQEEKEFLFISIADQGIGISENDIEKIFIRFYQVEKNSIDKPSGTGIGLSLTKELVEMLNGSLFISSEINKGTKISLILPFFPDESELISMIPEKAELISNLETDSNYSPKNGNTLPQVGSEKKKPLILVVEDNEDLAKYMCSFLSEKYLVKKAANGAEGYDKTCKYLPDLIISDVMMPVMDGFEFCLKLKKNKKLNHIPLIILTAKTNKENIQSFLEMGVDDYIIKPFESDLLETRIINLMNNRSLLKETYKGNGDVLSKGVVLVNRDEEFLQKAKDIIEKNLNNTDFNKDLFARESGVSRSQLYKRLISLTGQSPNEFVRNIKLEKAAYILTKGTQLQISEIGYMVGFTDPNYFTRKFREYFGKTPRQYTLAHEEKENSIKES